MGEYLIPEVISHLDSLWLLLEDLLSAFLILFKHTPTDFDRNQIIIIERDNQNIDDHPNLIANVILSPHILNNNNNNIHNNIMNNMNTIDNNMNTNNNDNYFEDERKEEQKKWMGKVGLVVSVYYKLSKMTALIESTLSPSSIVFDAKFREFVNKFAQFFVMYLSTNPALLLSSFDFILENFD